MNILFTCSCSATPSYARSAYAVYRPNTDIPPLYVSRKIVPIRDTLPVTSFAYQFITSALKKRGKYAYFIDYNDDGSVNEVYDFLKQKRIA